mgnify:CR=1 FL=1
MKLILIDSGLKHIKGHNFSTDLYIAKYFKENNFDVEILCLKYIDKETEDKFQKNKIKIKKIFDISTYSAVQYENEDTTLKSIEITVNSIKLYLKKNPFPDIAIWVPTNYPIQIFSNLFLKVARRPFIFLDAVYSNFLDNAINLYDKFIEKFKQRKDIIYLVYDENVKEIFSRFIPIDIEMSPFLTFSKYIKKEDEFIKKIGVFGLNKIFKENFSKSFLELLQQMNLKFEFHDPGEYFKPDKIFEHVDHHFKKILDSQNFSFFNFTNDLNNKIASFDSVLYFFNPVYYQLLASGIVSETIATGRPIILPQKNHPANLVKKKNCGAFFQWNDSESLKFSLENFIKNYQHFNEKSIIASRDWHKSEGIKKFCKFIVDKI